MKLNNKGMTMTEVMVSIALISIVLIFLMNLFLKVRGLYNQSKIRSDYEILSSAIINAVGSDIDKYGIYSVEYLEKIEDENGIASEIKFTFDSYRPTKLSERIEKILRVEYKDVGNQRDYYISYSYQNPDITSEERVTNIIRLAPEDSVVGRKDKLIDFKEASIEDINLIDIKIPLTDDKGNIYDININGIYTPRPLETSEEGEGV